MKNYVEVIISTLAVTLGIIVIIGILTMKEHTYIEMRHNVELNEVGYGHNLFGERISKVEFEDQLIGVRHLRAIVGNDFVIHTTVTTFLSFEVNRDVDYLYTDFNVYDKYYKE